MTKRVKLMNKGMAKNRAVNWAGPGQPGTGPLCLAGL